MNQRQKRRLYYLLIFACAIALATTLILYALKQNINVFFTPTQLINAKLKNDYHLRLGGVVKEKSVKREKNSLGVHFIITDFKHETAVYYVGILPDLFREGKGVIAEGYMNNSGTFIATQVLAKHDENYMPKNVYEELRKNAK